MGSLTDGLAFWINRADDQEGFTVLKRKDFNIILPVKGIQKIDAQHTKICVQQQIDSGVVTVTVTGVLQIMRINHTQRNLRKMVVHGEVITDAP